MMAEQVVEQAATDIWTIIGLSSLIASVVTVILGLLRDVLVERYRFKRQSEAGYLQSQIQMVSRLHFLLTRIKMRATGVLFKDIGETTLEINTLIEGNVNLLPPKVLDEWLKAMAIMKEALKEKDDEKQKVQTRKALEKFDRICCYLEEFANNDLIPKYRSIVGKTVAELGKYPLEEA